MYAFINLIVLAASSALFALFYIWSVRPATLEQEIGPAAYAQCARYRQWSSVFMLVATVSFVLVRWLPPPLPVPDTFPWPWWVSATLAAAIAVPSTYLFVRGMADAGEETMTPKAEHTLYGGIYRRMRHPQALGEVLIWSVMALLLHTPFLLLIAVAYVPVWVYFCVAEERDLVLRYGRAYEDYRARTGFWWPR